MRISKILPAFLLLPVVPLTADDLLLSGGESHLTGEVRSIEPSGVVELVSPLSPEPLALSGGAVRKVTFATTPRDEPEPEGLLELANGDRLPVRVRRMADDGRLDVESPDLGALEIPRDSVRTLQVGVRGPQTLYRGPNSLGEWTEGDGDPKNWTFRGARLRSEGRARAAADLELPRDFVLKFTLGWEQTPNFQVSFADPGGTGEKARDRYYLQFGRAGMEIKRESSQGERYNTIVVLNRTPDQYPDRRIEVELCVSRTTSRILLYLNGEPEGTFADPISPAPSGGGVGFTSNASDGQNQEVRSIEVHEFDDSHRRHHSEDRGEPGADSMISRDDERWTGRLLEIVARKRGPLFRFKSDFQEAPIELEEDEVSTVFLATGSGDDEQADASPFVLKVRGGGSLRVASCRFADGWVEAEHPLLGDIRFAKGSVLEMVWEDGGPAAEKGGSQ